MVVLGGGFGGLETAFYLRMLVGDRAKITLVSDQRCFLFKPNSIYVPFGLDPDRLRTPLAKPAARKDIELIQARAHEIDVDRRQVLLEGLTLPYDFLVVATGSGMRPAEIPGLAEHAISTWTPVDMLRLRAGFEVLIEAAAHRERRRMLFVVPPNNKCAGPLYEIVLMLDTWLRRRGARENVEIVWSTFEQSYIQAFGPRLHDVVESEFERRDIAGHTGWAVERVEPGTVSYANGEQLGYDVLVAFPPYVASTAFAGLPTDDRGFLETELASRRVVGHPEIFAVGDAGDFPVKQAFLAFLQADAAASHLAAEVLGGEPEHELRPGEHVRDGAVRQGDLRPGAAAADRRPRAPDRGPPRRRRRLSRRLLEELARREEDARDVRPLALQPRRAVPRRQLLARHGHRPQGDVQRPGQIDRKR